MYFKKSNTRMNNTVTFIVVGTLSILTMSCSKSSNSFSPSDTKEGGENTLNATNPKTTTCAGSTVNYCFFKETGQNSMTIPFTPSAGSISNFNIENISGSTNSQWSVDASACAGTISGTCNVTLTYTPNSSSVGQTNNITLNYSYLDNIGKTSKQSLQLNYKTIQIFSMNKTAGGNINYADYMQVAYANGNPIFGLHSDGSLYSMTNNVETQLLPDSTFLNFGVVPQSSQQQLILTNTNNSLANPNVIIYNTQTSVPTAFTHVTTYSMDSTQIYGSTENYTGNIMTANANSINNDFGTLSTNPEIFETFNDIADANLYTYSFTSNWTYYLCSVNTKGDPSFNCIDTGIDTGSAYYHKQIAVNNTVIMQTANLAGKNKIQAFSTSSATPVYSITDLNSYAGTLPMTYDTTNNILYVMTPTATENFFVLSAYNGANGELLWHSAQTFNITSQAAMPNLYMTSNNTAVVLAFSDGIYGYLSNSSSPRAAFGQSLFSLPYPQNSTPSVNLAGTDLVLSNTLDIPAILVNGGTPVTYMLNTSW